MGAHATPPRRRGGGHSTPTLREHAYVPPRLRELLARGLDARFLEVQAPAGYGKTAVVLQFLLDEELDPHWYTCTPEDADPAQLLAGIVRALGAPASPGARTALAAIASRDVRQAYRAVLRPFLEEWDRARGPAPVLVVDDADAVAGAAAALEVLDYTLAALAPHVRIVLLSRADLALPSLVKPRLDGGVVRVGPDDLLLSEEELRACARTSYGVDLSAEESAALARATAGWGIAVRLALRLRELGSSLPGDEHALFTPETRSHLFAYLASEVLNRVDERIAGFLRRTAVLETLDPAVCGRLSGEERPAALLQSLSSAGLPVMKAGWGTYRCHALLREYLLHPLSDDERRQLHADAGRACADAGDWPRALDHFAAASDTASALAIADEHGRELFYGGHGRALLDTAKNAPPALLNAHVRAEYWAAFAAARMFQLDWASAAFERVHENAAARGDLSLAQDALRALAQLLNGWGRYPAAAAVARRLLDAVPERLVASRAAVTLGYLITGMGATSEFREAIVRIRELLPQLTAEPRADAIAEAYARCVASVTLAMQGEFASARAGVNLARVLILGSEDDDIHTFVPWSAALVEFMAADPDRADEEALAAETLALQFGDLQRVLECRALRASTATMRGKVHEADRAFAALDELRGGGADYWGVILTLLSRPERARLHGDLPGALAAAEANHALAVSLGGGRFVCSTRLDVAYFRLLAGDAEGALEHARLALEEAVALDAGLLIYGANLMLAAASADGNAAAMCEALRIAEARDFRFLMPYAVRLPRLDAVLWRALETEGAARAALLLRSAGPPCVKAFRAMAPEARARIAIAAAPVLQSLGAEGRRALQDLGASVDRTVARTAREAIASLDAANPHRLSEREREVLRLLAAGLRTKDIAGRLVLTAATVSTHIQRIMSKTGTASRAELLALAAREAPAPVK
jgi:LuxR family maltose regulon positive regulatory protein